MFKFRIDSKDDYKGPEAYAGRRLYDEERKKRIFIAKRRLIGVDVVGLENQIAEKRKLASAVREKEDKWVAEQIREGKIFQSQQNALEKEKRAREVDLNLYRKTYQKKPCQGCDIKREKSPARLFDYDTRLGISSAQIFFGDDVDCVERRFLQRQQQANWLEQQVKHKKQAELDQRKAAELLDNTMKARDRKLEEISISERENQRKIRQSIDNFNQNMVARKRFLKNESNKQTEEDNLAEIYNMLGSDMLCENPDVAQSQLSENRKIPYMYRGMSEGDKRNFHLELERQTREKRERDNKEKTAHEEWERYNNKRRAEIMSKVSEFEKVEREVFEEQRRINLALSKEQQARKESMKNFRNEISDDFYKQFNKTTR